MPGYVPNKSLSNSQITGRIADAKKSLAQAEESLKRGLFIKSKNADAVNIPEFVLDYDRVTVAFPELTDGMWAEVVALIGSDEEYTDAVREMRPEDYKSRQANLTAAEALFESAFWYDWSDEFSFFPTKRELTGAVKRYNTEIKKYEEKL